MPIAPVSPSPLTPTEYPKLEFGAAVARVGLVAQANTPVKFHLGKEVQLTAAERALERTLVVQGALLLAFGQVELQPSFAYTRSMEDLEEAVGAPLLSRTTRRVALTDEGSRYYADSVQILRLVRLLQLCKLRFPVLVIELHHAFLTFTRVLNGLLKVLWTICLVHHASAIAHAHSHSHARELGWW